MIFRGAQALTLCLWWGCREDGIVFGCLLLRCFCFVYYRVQRRPADDCTKDWKTTLRGDDVIVGADEPKILTPARPWLCNARCRPKGLAKARAWPWIAGADADADAAPASGPSSIPKYVSMSLTDLTLVISHSSLLEPLAKLQVSSRCISEMVIISNTRDLAWNDCLCFKMR